MSASAESRGRRPADCRGAVPTIVPVLSTEGASFDSPPGHNRCNPGLTGRQTNVALKGRYSFRTTFVVASSVPRRSQANSRHRVIMANALSRRLRPDWVVGFMGAPASFGTSVEWRPVGAYHRFGAPNPGFRCAAPWAIEYDPVGVGGLRPRRSPERASFHSPRCNPGFSGHQVIVALKGHDPAANCSTVAPRRRTDFDEHPHRGRCPVVKIVTRSDSEFAINDPVQKTGRSCKEAAE